MDLVSGQLSKCFNMSLTLSAYLRIGHLLLLGAKPHQFRVLMKTNMQTMQRLPIEIGKTC